jgi:hypothetical protein
MLHAGDHRPSNPDGLLGRGSASPFLDLDRGEAMTAGLRLEVKDGDLAAAHPAGEMKLEDKVGSRSADRSRKTWGPGTSEHPRGATVSGAVRLPAKEQSMQAASLSRSLSLALVPALLATLTFVGVARADTTGNITVEATVEALPSITLEFCDDTDVQFGATLNAEGQPAGSGDNVTAIPGGEGVGAYYGWTPTCTSGPTKLLKVTSTAPWSGTVCLASQSGTSSLNAAGDDLRWSQYEPGAIGGYSAVAGNSAAFQLCSDGAPDWISALCMCANAGTHEINAYFYLQVDWDETPGTYAATTVWSVEV